MRLRLAASLTSLLVVALCVVGGCASNEKAPDEEVTAAAPLEGAAEASAAVLRLNEVLLVAANRSDQLGQAGREEVIRSVVLQVVDVPRLARASLGNRFQALTPEQKQRWLETYSDFHIAAAAYSWRRDRGARFEYLGVERAPRNTLMVRTRLDRAGQGADVARDHRLAQTDGRWRIIDIYTPEAISMVGMRRAEYLGLLANGSFDDLVAHMEKITASRRSD